MRSGVKLSIDPYNRVMLGNKQEKHLLLTGLLKDGYIQADPTVNGQFELTELGKTVEPKASAPRKSKRPPILAIYLGVPEVMEQRLAALDRIAAPFGGRSSMMQLIADGKLKVVESDK